MSALKTRINISLSDEVKKALCKIAKRDRVPEATKATRLLEAAIEMEEDLLWDEIAKKRDQKQSKLVSHLKAWK